MIPYIDEQNRPQLINKTEQLLYIFLGWLTGVLLWNSESEELKQTQILPKIYEKQDPIGWFDLGDSIISYFYVR